MARKCSRYCTMTSKRKVIAGILTLSLFALLGRLFALEEQGPDPQQLLDAVHKVSDLSALGSYVLTARVVFSPGDPKRETIGKLTISRDHELSRVELEISGKDEVQIHRDHASYIVASQRMLLESGLIGFDRTWDPLRSEETHSREKLGKGHAETIDNNRAWCFEKTTAYMQFTSKEKLCVDPTRPVLLSRSVGTKSRKAFLDYARAGAVEYPQRVSISREYIVPIEVNDIKIAPVMLAEELFKPPENAIEVESCVNQRYPEAKSTPTPSFPARASKQLKQGKVILNAIVAKDGTVAMAWSLAPDEYGFSENAEHTVLTWQFKPATCDGRPIATEMKIEVEFRRF